MRDLDQMLANTPDNPLIKAVEEQVFETALLQDGIHPDPAAMADRLTLLMEAATGTKSSDIRLRRHRIPKAELAAKIKDAPRSCCRAG